MMLPRLPLRWEAKYPYMVVDATMREYIPAHWLSKVIAPAFLGQDTDRCPLLVDARTLPPAELHALHDQLDEQTSARDETLASLLLAAPANNDMTSLAEHLGRRLQIQIQPQDPPKQFRYFDPGTFLQLPRILGEAGMVRLLGPVPSVMVPWAGHWSVIDRPSSLPIAGGAQYTPSQIRDLLGLGMVNRVANQLAPAKDAQAWQSQGQAIQQHVMRAQAHGLTSQDDLLLFALHAMQRHPRFDSHPQIQALLHELRSSTPDDELSYDDLTSGLTPAQWQQLADELGRPTHHQETPSP